MVGRLAPLVAMLTVASLGGPAGASARHHPKPIPENTQASPGAQNTFTLVRLSDRDWQLYVENTNYQRFIDVFNWEPPAGLTIRAVSTVEGGTCTLENGAINCSGAIAPASCFTCEGAGMTINFVGESYHYSYGWQPGILNVTQTSKFPDVRRCKKGQTSKKSCPCIAG